MEEFITLMTGGQTVAQIIAFIYFTLLGMVIIKLWRYNEKKKLGLRCIPPEIIIFSWSTWLNDNLLDFILAFMVAYTSFIFFPDAFGFLNKIEVLPIFEEKMFYGLLLGITFQYIMHKAFNSVKIINN